MVIKVLKISNINLANTINAYMHMYIKLLVYPPMCVLPNHLLCWIGNWVEVFSFLQETIPSTRAKKEKMEIRTQSSCGVYGFLDRSVFELAIS